MPITCKAFLVAPQKKQIEETLTSKEVKSIRREETWGGQKIQLRTSIEEVEVDSPRISGILKNDTVLTIPYRDGMQYIPQTVESKFVFDFSSKMRPWLFVFEAEQDEIAKILNSVIFGSVNGISAVSISPARLKTYAEANSVRMPVASWVGLDIPNLDKSVLSGADVSQTQDYRRYTVHGKTHYVMIELRGKGWVISISEETRVVLYSKIDPEDFLEFLKSEIVSMAK